MAKHKVGFQYYSVETDRYQDMKIKRLKKGMGCCGLAVYDYVLCEIYRVKGCFIEWDESTVFDVADYLGIKESLVHEIINYCGAVGLFDRELLKREGVLTSLAIQSRFIDWSRKAKRGNVKIPERLIILPEESIKLPEEPMHYSGSLPQSKVKESKVIPEEIIPEEKLMKDYSLESCTLSKDTVGYKVMEASVKLYKGFLKEFPLNRDLPLMELYEWVIPVRELMEKKKYTYEQIADVLNFAVKDTFWKTVILNTQALEKNFEKIKIKYQQTA